MNSKFGTALALSAVLLTGTAAAAINTQALVAPTKSTLETGATALLPVDLAVSTAPGKAQVAPTKRIKPSAGSTNQSQVTNQPSSNQGAGQPLPAETTPAPNQPTTTQPTTTSLSPSSEPTVIYGNPNPSTGGDDENDDENDDETDDEGQSNDGDDD
jgi:hypothetical protein